MYQLTQSKTIQELLNLFSIGWTRRKTAVSIPQAVDIAYQAFQHACPEWVDSLFDESFLQNEAAPLFAEGKLPTARQLATAWRDQFDVGTPEQRAEAIQKMLPAAATFLQMVKRELR